MSAAAVAAPPTDAIPTRKTSKALVAKVSNNGMGSRTVCDMDVSWDIQVAGVPTTGSVTAKKTGCKTLSSGGSTRFQFSWTHGPGEVTSGAAIDFTATVGPFADEPNTADNSDTETRTAK